jgi:hypothetical protein
VTDPGRLQVALAAIDAANAQDPNEISVRGARRPKELAHAELASEWLERLVDDPSDVLRIAVRAHHIRRWQSPRSDFPAGRAGYHAWRRGLQRLHAEEAAAIAARAGYDESAAARVSAIIRKEGLGRDAEVQAFEDALCLVFVELQLHALALRLEGDKLLDVTRKTLAKMSPRAVELARTLPLEPADVALLERAAAG